MRQLPRAAMVVSLAMFAVVFLAASALSSPSPQSAKPTPSPPTELSVLYRTQVSLRQPRDRDRLLRLGATTLKEDGQTAVLLVNEDQLESIARLGFTPEQTDSVSALLSAHTATASWLAASLEQQFGPAAMAEGRVALSSEQTAALVALSAVDSDGDGLTDTQEQWWCTGITNADSDGDGVSDGAEVAALKDWMGNRRAGPPSSGKPFAGWPPSITGCRDDDRDSVPDLAERWELGLNMNRESTDRDKFDDGQELFGNTNCPGGGYCGYGTLPRNEDWGVIFAEMPSWVRAPGNHPMVAAFPVPEIDVVTSSLYVETVTTVTTDRTIGSGTERSYSTAQMEGTSDSVANTVTWNEWEESYETRPILGGVSSVGLYSVGGSEPSPAFNPVAIAKGIITVAELVNGSCEAAAHLFGPDACSRGVKKVWDKSVSAASDAFRTIKSHAVDVANKAKDWIDKNLNLNSCSIGLPPTISCEIGFKQTQTDPTAGYMERSTYSGGTSDAIGGLYAHQLRTSGSSVADLVSYYPMQYPMPMQLPTRTEGSGRSHGGAQTTTHSEYEEHTVTNGEAFSSSESWGTATAVDSAHAADLWFTYKVRNTGTEYAREIADLAFNVYIGDDPNPAYTYFVGPDIGGDAKFHNFMPGEEHTYTSRRIPLTLEQMKAIDLGGPIRIVVEDFTYGIDELFYQDATNSGVVAAIEDGSDDGDELIDTYLIPTWGDETVQDIVARYFPYQADVDDNLIAIWTPEYRADTPGWCQEPVRRGTTLWCKHALSTADWWNIYLNNLGDGTAALQDTPAAANSTILFRFNKDTDLDGYSDRSELRLDTEPDDPASYPRPELLAGVHSIRAGSYVTATLSLLNTGLYDAYGVEAVMIAPDDTITVTNNTVGGSGRVGAQKQVIVGSRILNPSYTSSTWHGTARPASGGYYTGQADRVYTLTVQCGSPGGCDVGSGAWNLAWNAGAGVTDTLSCGADYDSPNLLDVHTLGVKVSLLSGKAYNTDTFTVEARTPRDTFQYTINSEPSEPIVIVSYNDPQGNHRFITPITLTSPTDNLAAYSGRMLVDPGVEIVTGAPFTTTAPNTTNLVVNNPANATLANAHLFLEFINMTGTVVAEVPITTSLPPGPTIVPATWSTSVFSVPYQADEDYIVMAFLTDHQGNILDTAARPLSSFQADPAPASAMADADLVWDFGTAQQGTLLQRQFVLASTGFMDLLTYMGSVVSVTVVGPTSRRLSPGDMAVYTVTLNTENLPVGGFEETIPIRTSDAEHPTRTITIRGNVTAGPTDSPGGATLRPLDWDVTITGSHSAHEWVVFTHTLDPEPQSLHPVKVYSQDYATLWGMGRYASAFGSGTASYEFGDGRDGDLVVGSGQTVYVDDVRTALSGSASAGQRAVPVATTAGFTSGQEVIIIQIQGTGAGLYEFGTIASASGSGLTLTQNLGNTYTVGGSSKAQALRVSHYRNVTVQSGGTLTAHAWDESTGGIVVARVSGAMTMQGTTEVNGKGFKGGLHRLYQDIGFQGESYSGSGGVATPANGGGGGSGSKSPTSWESGGGGGGYGSSGLSGGSRGSTPGAGGNLYGSADLATFYLGSGGGSGGSDGSQNGGDGGNGGGGIMLYARQVVVSGSMSADGSAGAYPGDSDGGGGGGGSGGSIQVIASSLNLGNGLVTAVGGAGGRGGTWGGADGGSGGAGRIRIEYCDILTGSTNPAGSTQRLSCYIAEQIESAPYTTARLSLPESFTDGRAYKVQYGRRLVFGGAAELTTTLRVPAGLFDSVALNALVSDVGAGGLTLRLDIGNNLSWDWTWTGNVDNATTLTSTSLAAAFNAYWANHGAPLSGTVDVPVRVSLSKGGQVLLTNLRMTPAGGIGVGSRPFGVAANPDTNRIYVALAGGDSVSVIDGATNSLIATIPVGNEPYGIGVNPGTNRIYAVNRPDNNVSVISGANNSVVATITVGSRPYFAGVNPNTNRIYVPHYGGDASVIDGATNSVVATIPLGSGPYGVGVNPNTNRIYVGHYNGGAVSVIDGGSNTVVATIPVGRVPEPVAVNPDTNRIYVGNRTDDNVSVIDGASDTVVATIPVGRLPQGIGVNTTTNRIYVANSLSDSVSVIDGATNSVVATVAVGSYPYGVGVNATTNRIYVANSNSDSVSVIDGATNFVIGAHNAGLRYLRLPATSYSSVTLALTVGESGSGGLTVAADVGVDATVDWSWSGSASYPLRLTTSNLAPAFNAYLSGRSGDVDVPIRFYLAPSLSLRLDGFSATASAQPDATLTAADIAFSAANPTESDTITATATLHNSGGQDSGGLTAAFFATAPIWGQTYIGSAFAPNIPAGGTAQASISWNTLGFTGTVPVRVVADLYSRVAESNESNNVATGTLAIRTRPDLSVAAITLSDDEPVVSETVTMTLAVRNTGQTAAGVQTVALYQDNPDAGGALLATSARPSVAGGTTDTITLTWTPTAPGSYRLFARGDRDGQVSESDETNNDLWRDVYVGFRGPILLDSGSPTDRPYTTTLGYGYLNPATATVSCGRWPHETMLAASTTDTLRYHFDHLLPGHFYHLDMTFYECDGFGRRQSVYIDDNLIVGPVALGDGQPHRLSIRLDPALYADHSIVVAVREEQGLDAAVSEISLYDIDYRYADSGAATDLAYSPTRSYGYLDGTTGPLAWGTLPHQSSRMDYPDSDPTDDPDNELRYRFDGLEPVKQYRLGATFYHRLGTLPVQAVGVDGHLAVPAFTIPYSSAYPVSLTVPADTYATDGSIVVLVTRTNASAGAFVNEIALEEETSVAPDAAFRATPQTGTVPLHVQFTDTSTGTVTARLWDFGDGITDTVANPTHSYIQTGTYTVSLWVAGPGGLDVLTQANCVVAGETPPTGTGAVVGRVDLQGRANDGGATVSVGAYSTTTTSGAFTLTDVAAGTYTATASMAGYLHAARTGVVVSEGMTTTPSPVTLLGGDATGDGVIDIYDLTLLGAGFGTSGGVADINGDGAVNVFDLVLVGANFGRAGPTPWP